MIALLARREHSRAELIEKLDRSGYDPALIRREVDALAAERLQSDERFAEAFLRSRMERGEGPIRIRYELVRRGVDESLVDGCMGLVSDDWIPVAERVWRRRFDGHCPDDLKERARQYRFLTQRGFSSEQINSVWSANCGAEA